MESGHAIELRGNRAPENARQTSKSKRESMTRDKNYSFASNDRIPKIP
jgi:hypothetical protein